MSWIHDDITWCYNECEHTECFRNKKNRLNKKGLYSAALLKDTDLCPLTNTKTIQNNSNEGFEDNVY